MAATACRSRRNSSDPASLGGWDAAGDLLFDTPEGFLSSHAEATVLALGGSWARLGSDGAFVEILRGIGVEVAPLRAANRRVFERCLADQWIADIYGKKED